MPKEKLNCAKCFSYADNGDTEHHQFCPTIAKDPEQAIKDYERGFKAYCEAVEREEIPSEDENNVYFMVGYNGAFLVDDNVWGDVEDLHINKLTAE